MVDAQFVFHCLNHRAETRVQPEGSVPLKNIHIEHMVWGTYEGENNGSHNMINNKPQKIIMTYKKRKDKKLYCCPVLFFFCTKNGGSY